MWFGPFAASAAAIDGLLQPYQPARVADGVPHDADWKWTTLDYSSIGFVGSPPVSSWTDLASVPRLVVADPERSEVGLSILLSTLDRARQVDSDVERSWSWWQQRAEAGLVLTEDDASASALVGSGGASHALTLSPDAPPLPGLAPIPHAIAVAGGSRNLDATHQLMDWLTSEAAGALLKLSPWLASSNGLSALLHSAPALDIDWARQQYTPTRQRWAQSGFGPTFTS
jgi:ABC-type Fe3+ transport system substrate-binding protein